MRIRAVAVALVALSLAGVSQAEAGHRRHHHHGHHHHGWDKGHVHHYSHYRGHQVYYDDPYAYAYEPRGYYPYYNSGDWRPAAELRWRRRCCTVVVPMPQYYRAWGYPSGRYGYFRPHRRWR